MKQKRQFVTIVKPAPKRGAKPDIPKDDAELREAVIRMAKSGFFYTEIAKLLNFSVSSVKDILVKQKLVQNDYELYHKRPEAEKPKEPADKQTTPLDFAKAEPELAKHFISNNGILYYKGVKLTSPSMWGEAIRDLNRIRKRRGQKQFTRVQEWVI